MLGFLNVWGEQLAPAHEAFRQAPSWALLFLRVPTYGVAGEVCVVCALCGVPELSWWLGIRDKYLTLPILSMTPSACFSLLPSKLSYFHDPSTASIIWFLCSSIQH